MKASEKAWNNFIRTGNTVDYLNYRELTRIEAAEELTPTEDNTNAPEHTGNSNKGDDDGRK